MITLIFGAQGSGKSTLARTMVKDFFPKQIIELSYNPIESFEEQIVPYFSLLGNLPYYTMFRIDGLHSIEQIGGFVEFYKNLQKKQPLRIDRPQFILEYQTNLNSAEDLLKLLSREIKSLFNFHHVIKKTDRHNCNRNRAFHDGSAAVHMCSICFNED